MASSGRFLPFSAVAMSFPTALYPSCTQLCWKHQFQHLQICVPSPAACNRTWLDVLTVGEIPKISPRAGHRVTAAKVIYHHQPNTTWKFSRVQLCSFYPFCLKFTFFLGEDRTGASLRTEAELLPASRSGKQQRSQHCWDRWPDLLWQQLLSGTTALPRGKAWASLYLRVSGLLPGSLAPSCTLCWAGRCRCCKEPHQDCGTVCSWSDEGSG